MTQGGIEATEANVHAFTETTDKLEQLKNMPAYALGARNMSISTLEDLHQEGQQMQQNFQQQLEDLKQCAHASDRVYQMLNQYNIPNTVQNVMAISEMLQNRNGAYRMLFQANNRRRPDSSMSTDSFMQENEDGDVEVDFDAIRGEKS